MKTKTKIRTKMLFLKIVGTLLIPVIFAPLSLLQVFPGDKKYPIAEDLESIGIMILCILVFAAVFLCWVKAKDLKEELDEELKNSKSGKQN